MMDVDYKTAIKCLADFLERSIEECVEQSGVAETDDYYLENLIDEIKVDLKCELKKRQTA